MVLGVLSDTHFCSLEQGWGLIQRLLHGPFATVDAVLHAGDLVVPELLSAFGDLPVYAVRGNCDPGDVSLPLRRLLHFESWHIGMVHGVGGLGNPVRLAAREFHGQQLDVLVFGHSHQPCCRREGGLLLFNPGSASDKRQAPFHSIGLLELTDRVEGRIVDLDSWPKGELT